jgi:hypothetical protein
MCCNYTSQFRFRCVDRFIKVDTGEKRTIPDPSRTVYLHKISQHVSILEETTFQMSQLYLNLDLIIILIIP